MVTNKVHIRQGQKTHRKHVTNIRPCPREHEYFQNRSFFYVVWPFVHTQTQYQITETEPF